MIYENFANLIPEVGYDSGKDNFEIYWNNIDDILKKEIYKRRSNSLKNIFETRGDCIPPLPPKEYEPITCPYCGKNSGNKNIHLLRDGILKIVKVKQMKKVTNIEEISNFDLYDITVSNSHCFKLENGVIAHNSMYPSDIVGGGTGSYYSSNSIFIIGRQQEKDGTEVSGYNFIINVEKSRRTVEKSKIPVTVLHNKGVSKWSGLMDMALESGHVIKPNNGWYSRVNKETGEIEDKKYRLADTNNELFWSKIIKTKSFNEWVNYKYKLSQNMLTDDEIDNQLTTGE